jgi:hypothetical protein
MARCQNNVPVQVGDSVTVLGTVVSVSGPYGKMANVVVQPDFGAQFVCMGADANAPAGNGNALSYYHQQYGLAGDQVSVPATVTAISGTGSIAVLTCTLRSGLSVNVLSGSCVTANQAGVTQGSL